MRTILLCGGQGTRIRGVDEDLPKPMLPIGGRPILWHILETYGAHGQTDFVLALGYKGWAIKEWFLDWRHRTADFTLDLTSGNVALHSVEDRPWSITFAETGDTALTGTRVKRAGRYIPASDDHFMVTYGDGVGDVDVRALIAFHEAHGGLATVTGVRPPGRFGDLQLDGTRVDAFMEKPDAGGGLINGGFLVLRREVLDLIPDGDQVSLESDVLTKIADQGQMHCFVHHGFWRPMDTFREYSELNRLWAEGRAPWRVR
jgi:glucose-1-phosphate cytidylyltransferase